MFELARSRLTSRGVQPLLALLAGAGQAVSLAGTDGQAHGGLQILCMATVCSLLLAEHTYPNAPIFDSQRLWLRGARVGWWFAWGWLCATFWWLFISMHVYGGMPSPLAAAAVAVLAGALALYYAAACGVWLVLMRDVQGSALVWRGSLCFAALWTLAELMRGQWFTGFPWGAIGYAHVDSGLQAYAAWVGVYGMGALAAAASMALSVLVFTPLSWRSRAKVLLVCGVVLSAPWAWQQTFGPWTQTAGLAKVRLLQGNIAQDEKFIPGRGLDDALTWYGQRLLENQVSLVVTPETAIALLPASLPPGYWAQLTKRYAEHPDQLALVGMPMGNGQTGYSNALISLGGGELGAYQYTKHHLVPFGEFIPPLFRWFIDLMNIPLGDFQRGALRQPVVAWQNQRLAPNICYEDLFGEELAAAFVVGEPGSRLDTRNDQAPTALVNVSNIAWFGNSLAIDQHLNISRLRAIELQRPMLRATNTGATAIIDHQGQVQGQLARHTRGELNGQFEGRTGLTPYAWWAGHWGLKPLWAACLLVCLWAWRVRTAAPRGRPAVAP
jgi:apolipoprotein N-acyltransferase